jgi:EAL domain-containing protein (putative c-di-GMP-specific phosphodiesterase class I)
VRQAEIAHAHAHSTDEDEDVSPITEDEHDHEDEGALREAGATSGLPRPAAARETPCVGKDELEKSTIVSQQSIVSAELAAEWREELVGLPPRSDKGRVLVVEAYPGHTAPMLQYAGYDVEPVDDGVTASQWLASAHFDAVLTDASPKGMTGIELLRFAREHHQDLPVLLMTGAPDFDLAQQAVEHGAFQFLLKPIPEDRLVAALDNAVRERKHRLARSQVLAMLEDLPTEVNEATEDHAHYNRMLQSLWMAYQPIVKTDGTLFAYEALVRSDEPGMSSAGEILDAAERLTRLQDLGRMVRSKAGGLLERGGDFALFVNLHSHDLMDETLVSPNTPLARLAPCIVLEITERAALHDVGEAKARMAELRALGYRIALDDLGAGYAGLTAFAELQPEIVKLDMGLVRNIDTDSVRRKLVGSIVNLSRELGILVVGEGVETEGERDVLIDLGCDLLQGYLYGKPERKTRP